MLSLAFSCSNTFRVLPFDTIMQQCGKDGIRHKSLLWHVKAWQMAEDRVRTRSPFYVKRSAKSAVMYQWFSDRSVSVHYGERLILKQTTHETQNESKRGVKLFQKFILEIRILSFGQQHVLSPHLLTVLNLRSYFQKSKCNNLICYLLVLVMDLEMLTLKLFHNHQSLRCKERFGLQWGQWQVLVNSLKYN